MSDDSVAGGLAGAQLTVNRSYSTGAVKATGKNSVVGGLLGQDGGIVANSYATGAVDAGKKGQEAGGLVGLHSGNGQINWSYATGKVQGGHYRGGVVGFADVGSSDLDDAYWDLQATGISDPSQAVGNVPNYPGATGLTTEHFKSGLPSGFDPNTWAERGHINNGYPYLLADPPPK